MCYGSDIIEYEEGHQSYPKHPSYALLHMKQDITSIPV